MSGNVQNLSKPGFGKIKATGLAQVFSQRQGHERSRLVELRSGMRQIPPSCSSHGMMEATLLMSRL